LRLAIRLAPQTEAAYQLLIAALIRLLQVVQQLAPLVHHLEQATTRMVVVLVTGEMVGELRDPRGQQSDLDFRRAGVRRPATVLTNDWGFFVRLEGHADRLQRRYPGANLSGLFHEGRHSTETMDSAPSS